MGNATMVRTMQPTIKFSKCIFNSFFKPINYVLSRATVLLYSVNVSNNREWIILSCVNVWKIYPW